MKIKYKMSTTSCLTLCPHGMGHGKAMVNSIGCQMCEHFGSIDEEKQILDCNHSEPKEPKSVITKEIRLQVLQEIHDYATKYTRCAECRFCVDGFCSFIHCPSHWNMDKIKEY